MQAKIKDTDKNEFYFYENLKRFSLKELLDIHKKEKERYNLLKSMAPEKHTLIPNKRQWLALQYLTSAKKEYRRITHIGLGGAMGSSKTTLALFWVISSALNYKGTAYAIARKTLASIIKSTLPSFYEMAEILEIPKKMYRFDAKNNIIHFNNSSKIYFLELAFKPDDPEYDRVRGGQFTGVVFEEANEIPEEGMFALIKRSGRWKNDIYNLPNKVLYTFNPTRGYIYERFYKPWRDDNEMEDTRFIPSLSINNPFITEDYIRSLYNMSEKDRRVYLLGDFEFAQDAGQLVGQEHIMSVFKNADTDANANANDKFIIVDVAGATGSDNTVVTIFDGWAVEDVYVEKGKTPEQVAALVKDIAIRNGVPNSHIAIDAVGLGEGVARASFLKGVYPFKSSNSSIATSEIIVPQKSKGEIVMDYAYKEMDYYNLRTQCAFTLASKIRTGEFKINVDPKTMIEVAGKKTPIKEVVERELALLIDENADKPEAKRKLISKSGKNGMKQRLGYSPDLLDTFIMRGVFDLIEQTDASALKPVTPLNERKFMKRRHIKFNMI